MLAAMETTTSTPDTAEADSRERNALVALLQSSAIFRDYQRAFQSLTSLPLELRAAGSFQAGLRGARHGNEFCALMAAKNKTCAACLQAQHCLESATSDTAGTVECFAGLNESVVPIRIGDQIVAFLLTGQVLFRATSATRARKAVGRIEGLDQGSDTVAAVASYQRSRVIPKIQYESVLRLLEIFATQLSQLSNELSVKRSLAESPAIAKARAFITTHLTEEISLGDVARAAGMSSFYFCKNFKKATGLTFTAYLARMRVETVKHLLLNPHKRVSEAAYEAGFQSLSQFNRVFHRIAGLAPSAYRERLHAPAAATRRHACAA
jgi:AraC-like DNA-binding protein/ligand-binding sensor protein